MKELQKVWVSGVRQGGRWVAFDKLAFDEMDVAGNDWDIDEVYLVPVAEFEKASRNVEILSELERRIEMKVKALRTTPYPDDDPDVHRLELELEVLCEFRDWVTPAEQQPSPEAGKVGE